MDKLAHMAEWEIKEAIEQNSQLRTDLRDAVELLAIRQELERKTEFFLNRPSIKGLVEGKG